MIVTADQSGLKS